MTKKQKCSNMNQSLYCILVIIRICLALSNMNELIAQQDMHPRTKQNQHDYLGTAVCGVISV